MELIRARARLFLALGLFSMNYFGGVWHIESGLEDLLATLMLLAMPVAMVVMMGVLCMEYRTRASKILFAVGFLALAGCEANVGVDLGSPKGQTDGVDSVLRAPEDDLGDPVDEPEPTQHPCLADSSCPMHLYDPALAFRYPENFEFDFPAAAFTTDGTDWSWMLVQSELSIMPAQVEYDMTRIERLRVKYGSHFEVKTVYGDRVMPMQDNGPYWSAGSWKHSNQDYDYYLTLENGRWLDTHTAATDMCLRRIYHCVTIIEIVSDAWVPGNY